MYLALFGNLVRGHAWWFCLVESSVEIDVGPIILEQTDLLWGKFLTGTFPIFAQLGDGFDRVRFEGIVRIIARDDFEDSLDIDPRGGIVFISGIVFIDIAKRVVVGGGGGGLILRDLWRWLSFGKLAVVHCLIILLHTQGN